MSFALLCVASCGNSASNQLIAQKKLWGALRPVIVTPLAALLPEVDTTYVCAMGPYEGATRPHYQSDEGHWILAVALCPTGLKFSLSDKLDFDSVGRFLKSGQAAAGQGPSPGHRVCH